MTNQKESLQQTAPPCPERPCANCGNTVFWLRRRWGKDEWICGRCHPEVFDKKGAIK